MAYVYFLLEQPEQPTQAIMWDVKTLTIGRAAEADLVLDDDEVSRKHGILTQDSGGFEIGDYRTANGTYVDGQPVDERARFLPGQVIEIGKARLTLQTGDTHPATMGHKLVYGSQLKTVGQLPAGADGNATVLGLGPALGDDLDDFVVEPMRSTGEESFEAGMNASMREFSNTADELDLLLDDDMAPASAPSSLELDEPAAPSPAPAAPSAPPAIDLLDDALELEEPVAPAPAPAPAAAVAPTPIADPSTTGNDPVDRMRRLKLMRDEGLISDEEFHATRARILAET